MKNFYILSTTLFLVIGAFLIANAQPNPFDIEFPIPELGNCGSPEECEVYCNDPSNINTCIAWAENQGVIEPHIGEPDDEFERHARELLAEQAGPGGCSTFEECDFYCSQPQNENECFAFGKDHGLIDPEEIRAIEEKSGPGGCNSRYECDQYCSDPVHTEECVLFAVGEGHMSQAEADRMLRFLEAGPRFERPRGPHVPGEPDIDVDKVHKLLETIDGPGGCKTFEECDAFCSSPGNEEACFAFAVEHELIPPDQVDEFRRLMTTEGPGGCIGRECEFYCEEPGREIECMEFAVEQGFMSQAEFEEARKFVEAMGDEGGPGGCFGRECEFYCEDPTHQDECFDFAKEHGLISPEEIAAMERIEARMEESGGPGGCRNETECMTYCSDTSRFDECAAFAVDVGFLSPDDARAMLEEFIGIEHYGPTGGFEGPGGFGPPPGFGGPGGFGPPPGFEDEFELQFQAEFEKRFQGFEQFKGNFEQGIPYEEFDFPEGFEPPPGFGPPPGFEEFGAPAGVQDPGIFFEESFTGGKFDLIIKDSDGIESFFIKKADGSVYSGQVSGCAGEYRNEGAFRTGDFPVQEATVTDCAGNQESVQVRSPLSPPAEPFQEGIYQTLPPATDFFPPDEFPGIPGEFESFVPPHDEFQTLPPATDFFPPDEFQQQFEEQFQQQYEQEFQQQYEQQLEQEQQPTEPILRTSPESLFGSVLQIFRGVF